MPMAEASIVDLLAPEDHRLALRIAEAMLFASALPLAREDIAARLPDGTDVALLLRELSHAYSGRGVNLVEVAGKYMFRTSFEGNAEGYLEGFLPGKAGHKKAVLLAPNYLAGQVAEQYFEKGFKLSIPGSVIVPQKKVKIIPLINMQKYTDDLASVLSRMAFTPPYKTIIKDIIKNGILENDKTPF